MRTKISMLGKHLLFELSIVPQATQWTTGFMNRTEDGYYIFCLDYDNMKLDYIIGELKRLQDVHMLSDIHIFRSSKKGYHAVSFDKLLAKDFVEIMSSSSCDESFKTVPLYSSYRNWVLRNFEKGKTPAPTYELTIRSTNCCYEQSNAHYKYFKKLYPEITNSTNTNYDDFTELTVIKYKTGGNVNG